MVGRDDVVALPVRAVPSPVPVVVTVRVVDVMPMSR